MKIIILILSMCSLTLPLVAQPAPEGTWSGAFIREGSIQLTQFHISTEGDSLTGYHHIVERELYREPLTGFRISGDSLFFNCRYGEFWMVRGYGSDELLGMSVRWNPRIKLHLKRSEAGEDSYSIQPFTVGTSSLRLTGQVYVPDPEIDRNRLLVLVHGSGQVTMSDRYYRTEALALVRRGYHVAVYDKRGNGASTGSMEGATLFDFADDAVSVMDDVMNRFGNRLRYGFYGISQGGWISTIATGKTEADDFLVLNVGAAVSVWQQEIDRVRFSMAEQGYEPGVIDRAVRHVELMFELVDDSSLWPDYLESSQWVREMNLEELVNSATEENDRHISWWRANRYDPAEDLQGMGVPVLSLMGVRDVLVPPATNEELMRWYLRNSGAPYYQVEIIEGVHHGLETYAGLNEGRWDWPSGYWVWPKKPDEVYRSVVVFLERL